MVKCVCVACVVVVQCGMCVDVQFCLCGGYACVVQCGLCGEREREAWAADLSRLTAASLPARPPPKGWSLHSPGETRILRGNTFVDGTVLVVYSGRDDMLRKEKAWGDAGALYADHSRQPS